MFADLPQRDNFTNKFFYGSLLRRLVVELISMGLRLHIMSTVLTMTIYGVIRNL